MARAEGELSREEMLAIVQGGGSVFYRGKLIVDVDSVPSDGEIEGIEGLEKELVAEQTALEEKRKKLARLKAAEAKVDKKAEGS